ncbi:MAG TPA: BatA and WFA domain-containing protein [Polyangia bacterium]|nr:BatA and WFA domain-containing protein [Polyangia bacterium]
MHFLAPSLLLGLLAAFLPAIIHRIGRRQARPVRFAAMELLLRAEREVSARRRLRDVLLLAARTGLAMALPLAFARPFAEVRSDLPAVTGRSQGAVVILDDSASMRRHAGGGTPFDVARSRARAIIEHLSGDSDVALVLASEGSTAPIAELAGDHQRVLAALDAVTCSARAADFGAALRRATQILSSSTRADRLIYVATDLQAAGWENVTPAVTTGAPQIVLLDASGGAAWTNRAVVGLSAEPAPEEGTQGIAVIAEIANFSAEPLHALGVTLSLDGAEVARGFVDIPAGGRARKRFVHAAASAGAHDAEVTIDRDDFPLDDRRACRVEASRGLRVLVVDGDPRTVRTEDETFFLEAALRAGGSGFSVSSTLPDDLGGRDLSAYGAIFLANVNRPAPPVAAALIRYVEAGGGLFISVGDRVDTDAWNQALKPILPQPLGLKRSAAALPGAHGEGETVDLRPAERLGPIDRRHPLLSAFPARDDGLSSARFFEYLLLSPLPDAPGRQVVLRYESGAPALVEGQVGRGRVLLLTTTIDREWTDLPIRPGFLPLVQEAARYLAGAPSGDAAAAILVGQKRELTLEPEDKRLEVVRPAGDSRWLSPASGADVHARRTVTFAETDEPGFYRVRAARADGTVSERPDAAFVVNLDARESDPTRLADDKRPDRAGRGPSAGPAPRRRLELWHALGAVAIALVLLESVLTLRFRRGRVKA